MTLRFVLDEDLSARIANGLRHRSMDAVSVHEIGRAGLGDEEQLTFAATEGRVFVTYNRADFQILDAQWRLHGLKHSGILWCNERSLPRRVFGDVIRALEHAAGLYESLEGLCLPLARASSVRP